MADFIFDLETGEFVLPDSPDNQSADRPADFVFDVDAGQFIDVPQATAAAPEPAAPAENPHMAPLDYAKRAAMGVGSMVSTLGWVSDKLPVVAQVNQAAKALGLGDWGQAIQDLGNDAVDYWHDSLSEEGKQVAAQNFIVKNPETGEYEWGDAGIEAAIGMGMESLAPTVLGMGAGAAITKGAQALAGAPAVLKVFGNPVGRKVLVQTVKDTALPTLVRAKAARKLSMLDKVLGAAGFGLGEGLVGGASTGQQVEQAVLSLDPEKIQANERWQQVYQSADPAMSEAERRAYATTTIAKEAGTAAGAQSGLLTGLLGAPMGAFFGSMLGRTGARMLAENAPGRLLNTAKGAVGEAAQEFTQSAGEQYLSNVEQIKAGDTDLDKWDNVMNQAVGGAIAGGLMGGGFSFAQSDAGARKEKRQAKNKKLQQSVDILQKTAVEAVNAGVPADEVARIISEAGTSGNLATGLNTLRRMIQERAEAAPEDTGGPETPAEVIEPAEFVTPEQRARQSEEDAAYAARAEAEAQAAERDYRAALEQRAEQEAAPEIELSAYQDQASTQAVPDTMRQALEAAGIGRAAPAEAPTVGRAVPAETKRTGPPLLTPEVRKPGTYQFGKYKIDVANPAGTARRDKTLTVHYGDIEGTIGRDNEPLDTWVGGNPDSDLVVVVNQLHRGTGAFDEHKVLLGFDSEEEAKAAYLENMPADFEKAGVGSFVAMSRSEFDKWVNNGDLDAPIRPKVGKAVPDFPGWPVSIANKKHALFGQAGKVVGRRKWNFGTHDAPDDRIMLDVEVDGQVIRIDERDTKDLRKPQGDFSPAPEGGFVGRSQVAVTPDGKSQVPTQYRLGSLDDLTYSHDRFGKVNPAFPLSTDTQNRDRTRQGHRDWILSTAQAFQPALMAEGADTSAGAPIVETQADGKRIIKSGNGRAALLEEVFEQQRGPEYQRYLEENAEQFGLTADQVRAAFAANPRTILYREAPQGSMNADLVRRSNTSQVASLAPAERATSDRELITPEMLARFSPSDSGDLLSAGNSFFMAQFLSKLTPAERGDLLTADGRPNRAAAERVRAVIFDLAYNDPTLSRLASEEDRSDIQQILNGLIAAAPHFVRARALVPDYPIGGLDIVPSVVEAIHLLRRQRREDKADNLDAFLAQGDMIKGENPEEVERLVRFFDASQNSARRMRIGLTGLGEYIEKKVLEGQNETMFGPEPTDLPAVLNAANEQMTEQGEGPLFQRRMIPKAARQGTWINRVLNESLIRRDVHGVYRPDPGELARFAAEVRSDGSGRLRWLVNPDDTSEVMYWDAEEALHSDVQNRLGWSDAAGSTLGYIGGEFAAANIRNAIDAGTTVQRHLETAGKYIGDTTYAEKVSDAMFSRRPQAETAGNLDMIGGKTDTQQDLANRERELDRRRNTGQESVETGDAGDLFSQAQFQTDLFDQPAKTTTTFTRTDGKQGGLFSRRGGAQQVEMFTPAGEIAPPPPPEPEAGGREAYIPRRVSLEKVGEFETAVTQINEPADVADILLPLLREPQEQLVFVAADKSGRPLAVLRHSIGRVDSASFDPSITVGAVLSVPDIASVFMGHNHPSGGSTQSTADMRLNKLLRHRFEPLSVSYRGSVVVTESQPGEMRWTFEHPVDEGEIGRGKSEVGEAVNTVPVVGRKWGGPVKNDLPVYSITTPDLGKGALRDIWGKHGQTPGIMLLNTRYKVVGWLPLTGDEMRAVRALPGESDPVSDRIERALHEANSNAVILAHDQSDMDAYLDLNNVRNFINAAGGPNVIDAFVGQAPDESGSIPRILRAEDVWTFSNSDTGPFYSVGDAAPGATVAQVSEWVGDIINAVSPLLDMQVVQSTSDIPGDAVFSDVEGATFIRQGKIYLVADNIPNQSRAVEVAVHEAFGHASMEAMPEFADVLDQVQNMIAILSPDIAAELAEVKARQGRLSAVREAKEVIALIAEKGAPVSIFDRAIDATRRILRRMGVRRVAEYSKRDLQMLTVRAAREAKLDAAFARENPNLTEALTAGREAAPLPLLQRRGLYDSAGRPRNPVYGDTDEMLAQLREMGEENDRLLKPWLVQMDKALGTKSVTNFKSPKTIVAKARRPSVLAKKPWFDVPYIRDSFRFKTVVLPHHGISAIPKAVARVIESTGAKLEKYDPDMLFRPKMWGWRASVADLRMPNGQLVEYYLTPKRLSDENDERGHVIFEKWRDREPQTLAEEVDRWNDVNESVTRYNEAWAKSLVDMDYDSEITARASFNIASDSVADVIASASNTRPVIKPRFQGSPGSLDALNPSEAMTSKVPSSSLPARTFDIGATSSPSINESPLLSRVLKAEQSGDDAELAAALEAYSPDEQIDRALFQRVYHGTPHRFDRFDAAHIGQGEGAQAYGHGLYFAENPGVAKTYSDVGAINPIGTRGDVVDFLLTAPSGTDNTAKYLKDVWAPGQSNRIPPSGYMIKALNEADADPSIRKKIERMRDMQDTDLEYTEEWNALYNEVFDALTPPGHLYEVEIPGEMLDRMLDWDAPLSEQPESVRKALADKNIFDDIEAPNGPNGDPIRTDLIVDDLILTAENDARLYQDKTLFNAIKNYKKDPSRMTSRNVINRKMSDYPYDRDIYKTPLDALEAEKGLIRMGEVYKRTAARIGGDTTLGKHVGDSALMDKGQAELSRKLYEAGIPGIRYFDGDSRNKGEGTRNVVIFPGAEDSLRIVSRDDEPLFSRRPQMDPDIEAAIDRTMSPPSDEVTFKDKLRSMVAKVRDRQEGALTQAIVDQFHSIKLMEERAFGSVLDASESAYKAALATKNLHSVVAASMIKGAPVWRDGAAQFVPGRKGPIDIFKPATQHRDGNLLELWEFFAATDRADRLLNETNPDGTPREKLFTQEDIERGRRLEAKYPFFRQVLNEYQVFNSQLLDFAEQSGVIGAEERTVWERNDYVPFYRAMEDVEGAQGPRNRAGLADQRSGIRRLTGGEEKLNSIFENIVMNMAHLLDASFKNVAMQRVVAFGVGNGLEPAEKVWSPTMLSNAQMASALRKAGLIVGNYAGGEIDQYGIQVVERMTQDQRDTWQRVFRRVAPAGRDVVSVMVDGRPEYYRVNDPLLLSSITGLGPETFSAVMDLFRVPKRLLTGAITADPAFMIANWMRDTLSTWVISDAKMTPLVDAVKGLKAAWLEDEDMMAIMMAGAGGGGFYDSNPEDIRKLISHKLPAGKAKHFANSVITPGGAWKAWRRIGAATENANRIAVYRAKRAAGASVAEAAYEARDVLNFTMSGDHAAMRWLAQTVPFMNARIQGLYRLGRGAKESPAGFLAKGSMIMAATLALLLRNNDDDRYNELPEWDKDIYWHFFIGGEHFRLPKPFEVGVLFGSVPERLQRAAAGHDDLAVLADFANRAVFDTFSMNPIPQLVKPIWEQSANRSFFTGSPIVGLAEQGLEPEAQYRAWTSETSRMVAEKMPDWAPEWLRSPRRLEHLVRGYLGTLGMYALGASDSVTRTLGDFPERPEGSLYDAPVIQRFVRDPEPRYTRYHDALYDAVQEANSTFRTLNRYMAQGKVEAARELQVENIEVLQRRPALNAVRASLTAINNQESLLMFSDLSGEEKQARLDELRAQKNEIVRQAAEMMEF